MEVRAKKSLGQHFLTDQGIAQNIVGALQGSPVLEVGPGMGVLTRYLIPRMAEVASSGGSTASLRSAPPISRRDREDKSSLSLLRSGSLPLNVPRAAVVSPSRLATSAPTDSSRDLEAGISRPAGAGLCESKVVEPERPQGAWGRLSPQSETGTPLSPPRGCRGGEGSSRWLKAIEIDKESVAYLRNHFPELGDGLIEGDFLKMDLRSVFPGPFSIIGNFPYNISSQIFFKIIDNRDLVPEVVCMIQKEVAERIAEKPGTKTYGILSVFLQAWYDIEYLFTVGSGAFNPPPKVQSAVIRLTRNSRTSLGCDEKLFKTVVKTAFGQRRKTLRNSLKPLLHTCHSERREESPLTDPVFDLRPERLSVEDFIALTLRLTQ